MKIKIWDIPTRLFHWLLVAAFGVAYFTSGTERLLWYHSMAGYTALGLVLFRVFWGFEGNRYARFKNFVKGWSEVRSFVLNDLRLKPPRSLGHNPAVGWMVLLMLCLTLAITLTGIVTFAGEEGKGLLAGAVSFDTGVASGAVHAYLALFAVAVIAVHVAAALFHDFVLRENLVLTMITGMREDDGTWAERVSHLGPEQGRSKVRLAAWLVLVFISAIGVVYLPKVVVPSWPAHERAGVVDKSGSVVTVPVNEAWETECSACHGLFHPTLLPAVSWRRVMAGLDEHFGDDASVDEQTASEIEGYLVSYSADRSTSEASRKILASIEGKDAPLRITETGYWVYKHSDIPDRVWKRASVSSRSNCAACHPKAEDGSFDDYDIRVPER
ncbi:MAG: cytochrome b/b6 domain-containing protein [Thermodesulfobacteriota bacterium]